MASDMISSAERFTAPHGVRPANGNGAHGAGDLVRRNPSVATRTWVASIGPVALRVGILIAGAAVLFEVLVAGVMHDFRQQHLGSTFAAPQSHIPVGGGIAVVQIPRIQLNEVVVEGAGVAQLRAGPGHLIHTPVPGVAGTSVILGHRSRFGAPFEKLGEAKEGDQIIVKPRSAPAQIFLITSVRHVAEVVTPAQTTEPRLTLITSGSGTNGKEYVVVEAGTGGVVTPQKASASAAGKGGGTTTAPVLQSAALDLPRGTISPLIALWVAVVVGVVIVARRSKGRRDPLVVMAVGVPVLAFALYQLALALDAAVGSLV